MARLEKAACERLDDLVHAVPPEPVPLPEHVTFELAAPDWSRPFAPLADLTFSHVDLAQFPHRLYKRVQRAFKSNKHGHHAFTRGAGQSCRAVYITPWYRGPCHRTLRVGPIKS